jgi:3-hydroxybutyryl-CoA dehydrogenase
VKVAVLGAGTMGQGIAHVSAAAGHEVKLRDVEQSLVNDGISAVEDALQEGVDREKITDQEKNATLDRLSGTTDLGDAVESADLVIEAVPEDIELKKEVFRDVEAVVPNNTILATNTSALSPSEIANSLDTPERFVALHFFNPPHLMDLVEIIIAEQTSQKTEEFVEEFIEELGKETVIAQDFAGFATSRLGLTLGLEAIRMVEQGVASPADIDAAMVHGYNYPMGPLELTDLVGLDVRLDIAEHLRDELGERFKPPQLLRRKVRAGKHGQKTGEGFYIWEDGERVAMSGDW